MSDSAVLNPERQMLRFTTAGSVDDGKSTLIGRLLYDSKAIFEDQLEAVETSSKRRGDENVNLALVTDGLKSEREQGITIDVAYRYFATPERKFIIADTPGHVQYTRNMVTGASTANLAVILIDARNGITEQTYRHTFIANLLGIRHLIVGINKMDLVDYKEEVYEQIINEFRAFTTKLDIPDIRYVPISALHGDNVVDRSENMSWYDGATLLYSLETVEISSDENMKDCRMPVQTVIRPHSDAHHDFRGYAGKIAGGVFKPGDEVVALPSGYASTIDKIFVGEEEKAHAYPPMSVTMTLKDDIDISRGDMLARPNNQPDNTQDLDVMLCWFGRAPMQLNGKYGLRHTTREAKCILKEQLYKVDINTLHREENDAEVTMNDIARVRLRVAKPLLVDAYKKNRTTGSIILFDEFTNEIVAAGMVTNS